MEAVTGHLDLGDSLTVLYYLSYRLLVVTES